jgi:fibronectin type 3 domain-containing protein
MMLNKLTNLVMLIFILSMSAYSQTTPPQDLKASVEGSVVKLNWTSAEKSATYNIYRASANSSTKVIDPLKLEFKKISTVTEPAYEDKTDAASGMVYVYYVATVNSNGVESAGSNYVNAKIGETGTDQ